MQLALQLTKPFQLPQGFYLRSLLCDRPSEWGEFDDRANFHTVWKPWPDLWLGQIFRDAPGEWWKVHLIGQEGDRGAFETIPEAIEALFDWEKVVAANLRKLRFEKGDRPG